MEVGADIVALQRARMLLGARRYQEAATIAYECAAMDPGDPFPLVVAAWAEIGLKRMDAAESAARSAVGFAPTVGEAHRVLGAVLTNRAYAAHRHGSGRPGRRAVAAAKGYIRLAPTDASSHLALADACVAARRPRLAVEASNTALALAPNLAQTWLIRARAARVACDYPVAEASIREALSIEPENYLANNELGMILRLRGRTVESIQQFAATASIDPLAGPARGNILRYGAFPFLFLTLLVTSPILLAVPQFTAEWIWGSIGINFVLWRWEPTKRVLERRALAIALWRSHRPVRRSKRRDCLVPPETPIQLYRNSLTVSILCLLFMALMAVLVSGAVVEGAPLYLPLTLLLDVPTVALGWFICKRIRPRPGVRT